MVEKKNKFQLGTFIFVHEKYVKNKIGALKGFIALAEMFTHSCLEVNRRENAGVSHVLNLLLWDDFYTQRNVFPNATMWFLASIG